MRFLVSICNQRAEPVRLPGTYLFEIDSARQTATPVPLGDSRLDSCVGITGLARHGDDLLANVQSLTEPCMLVRFGTDYRVKNVWPLALVQDAHSLTVSRGKVYLASTGTDSVVEFEPGVGEKVFWRDNDFHEDTVHLNSVLWFQGCLYATAFGKKTGERWSSATAGYLLNLSTGRVVVEPIAHPHSATFSLSSSRDGLYWCASTHQSVCREDGQRLQTGSGFTRGLIVTATHLYVGISKHRGALSDPCGVRIYERRGDDLSGSRLSASIDLSPYGQEIYDLLPLQNYWPSLMDETPLTLSEELAHLRVRLAARDAELSRWRQQYLIVNSLWVSVQESRAWKLSAPLRALRRWLAPRGFDQCALMSWQQLQQLGPDTWRSHGADPQFFAPCLLPAGWVRLQLQMTSSVRGRVELFADYGDGFRASECLQRVECQDALALDCLVYLPRPARAIRFDPLDAPGDFRLAKFQVVPLSIFEAARQQYASWWRRFWQIPSADPERPGASGEVTEQEQQGAHVTIADRPLVSIVIACAGRPTRMAGGHEYHLARCLASVRRVNTYQDYELIVVHDDAIPEDLMTHLMRLGARSIICNDPFNRARAWNAGAAHARGSLLVFLHEDVEIVTPHWLEAMLQFAMQAEIGAVRGRPYLPDCRNDPSPRDFQAVFGACLMTRSDVFRDAGGFTEEFGLCYADVDYCLKVGVLDRRVVEAPEARFVRHSPRSRLGMYPAELQMLQSRWPQFAWDASHNPDLSQVCYNHRA